MKKRFFTKKKIFIFILIAALIAAAGFVFTSSGKSKTTYITDTVQKKNLLQTVSEVGTVKSPSQIDLNFSTPGKLAAKFAAVGDKIKAGQVLAQLDFQSLVIQKQQAAANLSSAQANLTKLLQGATASQLSVTQAQVDQANASYAAAVDNLNKTNLAVTEDIRQAQNNLNDLQGLTATVTTYQQAVISARENLLNDINSKLSLVPAALDSVNTIVTDDNVKDSLSSKNKTYLALTKSEYADAGTLLAAADISLALAESDRSKANVEQAIADSLACLKKTSAALDDMYNALVNGSINNQTTLNTYKTNISGQITSTNGAVSLISADGQSFSGTQAAWDNAINIAKNVLSSAQVNGNQRISAAQNAADTAKQSLGVAQKQLAELKAPPRKEDISLAQAQVSNAQAALNLVNKQIDDATIKSPIDGQVVKDNYNVGEQTSLAMPIFSVLAENDLEIDVDISESDIAKIKESDAVEITLDAFGPEQKFNGAVYFIDPASTVIQDVTYYRVKIRFTDQAGQLTPIRPGMTANVTIIANRKDNVLTVPERAVIAKTNGIKIVRVLNNGVITEISVKTGLRGDDGSIEILEGNLSVGQTIVVFVNTK
jgi:RND family efflux transporter MFP subunit